MTVEEESREEKAPRTDITERLFPGDRVSGAQGGPSVALGEAFCALLPTHLPTDPVFAISGLVKSGKQKERAGGCIGGFQLHAVMFSEDARLYPLSPVSRNCVNTPEQT